MLFPLQPFGIGDRVSKNRSDLLCGRIHRRPYFVSANARRRRQILGALRQRQALRRRLSRLTVAGFPSGLTPQAHWLLARLGSLAWVCIVWPGGSLTF